MSMIKIENLTFSYPTSYDNIFESVNFQIDTDWKLGFMGRNGRGKTTFLNLLLGNYEYSGKIISSVKFDYFPYQVCDKSKMTTDILSEVCPVAEEWEFIREFNYLEVEVEALYRPFETLSNGEQTKALLAALFLNEGHFLLIDEPTNHLDMKAREIVSAYLKKKKGFILVSHDRSFIDGCVDHILSINRTNIDVVKGNFSSWQENKQRQDALEIAADERLKKEIRRLSEASKRISVWSDKVEKSKNGTTNSGSKLDKGFVGHKAAKMMKRSKAIEARQQQSIAQKSALLKNLESAESLKISPLSHYAKTPVTFSDVQVIYNGNAICKPINFSVNQGDRIALSGKNGSGKSSLLKLLIGETIEYTGIIYKAQGLIISYVPQDTSHLFGRLSDFAGMHKIDESLFKAILIKLGVDGIQFDKDIQNFSEGQKKKVLIAKSLCEKAHLYIWDEPLNFIDVYSRIQIEQLIQTYCPTMIFVEHDFAFQEAVATKSVLL